MNQRKMSIVFEKNWNDARQFEEKGHKNFQDREYNKAAEYHKRAAELFKKSLEFIDVTDEEIRKKILGNYYIELANYYHCLATLYFYNGEKQKALENYQRAIVEQKRSIQEYERLKDTQQFKYEINTLKIILHFYLTYENLCSAQIAFLNENYPRAVEYFKTAEIHTNLELEFISEVGDFERLKRGKARFHYIKGQIARAEALIAMREANRKEVKEKYLIASELFEEASKLYPEWREYGELAKKAKRMAAAIKDESTLF